MKKTAITPIILLAILVTNVVSVKALHDQNAALQKEMEVVSANQKALMECSIITLNDTRELKEAFLGPEDDIFGNSIDTSLDDIGTKLDELKKKIDER